MQGQQCSRGDTIKLREPAPGVSGFTCRPSPDCWGPITSDPVSVLGPQRPHLQENLGQASGDTTPCSLLELRALQHPFQKTPMNQPTVGHIRNSLEPQITSPQSQLNIYSYNAGDVLWNNPTAGMGVGWALLTQY